MAAIYTFMCLRTLKYCNSQTWRLKGYLLTTGNCRHGGYVHVSGLVYTAACTSFKAYVHGSSVLYNVLKTHNMAM